MHEMAENSLCKQNRHNTLERIYMLGLKPSAYVFVKAIDKIPGLPI